jgi:hypothetical protein
MNKQLETAQKRVAKITAALEKELGLSAWWKIKHVYSELPDGATESIVGPTGPGTGTAHRTSACTMVLWQYRQAEITWYLPSVAIVDDDYLEWTAVHEYVHILNAPLAEFLYDYLQDDESALEQLRTIGHHSRMSEFVTETLARVIQRGRGKDVPA